MEAYQNLSALVYDIDKPIGKSFGDLEFYQSVLSKVNGKILEPACGNGRLLIPLFKAGYKIEGFDQSDSMLKHLKKHCEYYNISPIVWRDSMESFRYKSLYDAVILPAGSFMLLKEESSAEKTINRFHSAMNRGAKLFIDYYLDDVIEVGDEERRTFAFQDATIYLTMQVNAFDALENTYTSHHFYEYVKDGKTLSKETEIFPLKFYTHKAIQTLLESNGFKIQTMYYDYQEIPNKNASMYTIEAIKL